VAKIAAMPSIYDDDFKPLELDRVKTYPLASRPSKVNLEEFAKPSGADPSVSKFLDGLPNVLAVRSFRELGQRIRRSRELKKPVIWGIGGHVIKTGLAPVIIDLMKHGFVSGIAANGSVLVHDAEIAMVGSTSEDVDATLSEGVFGGAEETGQLLNGAARDGARDQIGLGEAVGRALLARSPKHRDYSLLCVAYESKIPFTAHVTIGGDIAHFHPGFDGAALGATTHTDFRCLAELVRRMDGGGVYLNVGSAVVLPEVFLKAVALARNRGVSLDGLTTVNIDFTRLYRPQTNVVSRPVAGIGRGYSIVGHHEIMIPLLAAALIEE
jgi:hypothetical protein